MEKIESAHLVFETTDEKTTQRREVEYEGFQARQRDKDIISSALRNLTPRAVDSQQTEDKEEEAGSLCIWSAAQITWRKLTNQEQLDQTMKLRIKFQRFSRRGSFERLDSPVEYEASSRRSLVCQIIF